ncbi:adenine phosphoribosyltransferase [Noviherbaspirillum humi]|uniref:Adenine phosphoribosyltransferase n=1 Tax=Noviherbaspirillum humi TaxID=1688639 RepID=A0A239KN69_9BURK|nr:adenine phosphoribosyltransferase [Noviherbaspirillum humi]SNT19118.1 adenine phosphoribosyltransferase [Noviherbaspirillum humi]
MTNFLDHLTSVPDFPVPGVTFRDISPLLASAQAFADAIGAMKELCSQHAFSHLAGIESRGFIFGSALAVACERGFVMVRKPGKLPTKTISESYGLEYGSDRLEIEEGLLPAGASVILVDDVLATGGTLIATARLMARAGATVAGAVCLLDIGALDGKRRLQEAGIGVKTLLTV